jgi:hypothetical protein
MEKEERHGLNLKKKSKRYIQTDEYRNAAVHGPGGEIGISGYDIYILRVLDLKRAGYTPHEVERLLSTFQETSLKEELREIARERSTADISEIVKMFPPAYKEDIQKINKKLNLFPSKKEQ